MKRPEIFENNRYSQYVSLFFQNNLHFEGMAQKLTNNILQLLYSAANGIIGVRCHSLDCRLSEVIS